MKVEKFKEKYLEVFLMVQLYCNLLVTFVTSTEILGFSFKQFNKNPELSFSTIFIVIMNCFPDSGTQFTVTKLAFIGDNLIMCVTLIGRGIRRVSWFCRAHGAHGYKKSVTFTFCTATNSFIYRSM